MKMMKKRFLFLSLTILFIITACSNPVADELEVYINEELSSLADLEEEAIYEYNSVTGENFTDDADMFYHIQDVVLPLYEEFVSQLESITLESSEIRDVHEIYVKAANTQSNGLLKTLFALEYQDHDMMLEANDMLSEGRAGIREFHGELEALLNNHNLDYEK
ncbi:hypothetical protein J2T56_002738 [Natronobacillus azotifigens]|uniref:Lipoprotein n=1 Tax=Natronobacillus azotifigens TaxID=472978 RepID=A0A9J6RBY8_9BACI|nr:hypothetical protein [Natronobacillus azotifigens]MCZ0702851.1 hypothetical protein [Natronobacillus azotifigens]